MNKLRTIALLCAVLSCTLLFNACANPTSNTLPESKSSAPIPPSAPAPPAPVAPAPPTPAPVPDPSGLPTPPANAVVFDSVEDRSGWGSCASADCAGGSANATYWMAQNQTAPSLDGNSAQFYNAGAWANALWWLKLGAHNSATNFLWDFYFQVDDTSLTSGQALEFDAFQFIAGYNYMIGSQCDYGNGKWDVWDELNGHWIPTSIACPKFTPGTWHHIQWYLQRATDSTTYRFVTLVVDGTPYAVNQSYGARYNGWRDDLGVQYQLDVNATGAGYPMWVDKSTLTVW